LVRHLGINETLLRELLDELNSDETTLYRSWERAKKQGGTRPIDAPVEKLKFVQRLINDRILQPIRIHRAALGGVRGKHLRENLLLHVGTAMVSNFDLEQFFLNVAADQVFQTFRSIGAAPEVAQVLTRLTTFRGRLPQGAPTSTMLANVVAGYGGKSCLDGRIEGLCRKHKASNGRWVDDISISGPTYLRRLKPTVERIIQQTGFKTNKEKTSFASRNEAQIVTQHRVNEKPNTAKEERRRLRAMLHKIKTQGPQAIEGTTREELKNSLQGKIGHLLSVNPTVGRKFLEDFNSINWN
jgi:hypothetical protein